MIITSRSVHPSLYEGVSVRRSVGPTVYPSDGWMVHNLFFFKDHDDNHNNLPVHNAALATTLFRIFSTARSRRTSLSVTSGRILLKSLHSSTPYLLSLTSLPRTVSKTVFFTAKIDTLTAIFPCHFLCFVKVDIFCIFRPIVHIGWSYSS